MEEVFRMNSVFTGKNGVFLCKLTAYLSSSVKKSNTARYTLVVNDR